MNLDATRLVRTIESHLGSAAAQRYRAWSIFRRSGLPLVLLIGGCTGTGKSTVAAELSLRLDIGRTQSTDILREVMRLFVSREAAPELHSSTYEVWRSGHAEPAGASWVSPLIDGFLAQAASMAPAIDGVIDRSVKEGASTIIEGIHIHPAYHEHLAHEGAVFVPVLLTTPTQEQLRSHYCHRDRQAPARGASRYLRNLEVIWQLQTYLVEEAARCGVTVVANVHLDQTVQQVMELITNVLLARLPRQDV